MGSSIGSFTSGTPVCDGSPPALGALGAGAVLGGAAGAAGLTCAAAGELARQRKSRHALKERIVRIDSVLPQIGKHKEPRLTARSGFAKSRPFHGLPGMPNELPARSIALATQRFSACDGSTP